MLAGSKRAVAAVVLAGALLPAAAQARPDPGLGPKLFAAFRAVKSYKLTVLGSVRSSGVFVAPNRYAMTTVFEGKVVKTVFIGKTYWIYGSGKWEKSATPGSNLEIDVASLLPRVKASGKPLERLPDETHDGKTLGTFQYTTANGTEETCNFDRKSFRVTRCKADELIILYSGFNDRANVVEKPR